MSYSNQANIEAILGTTLSASQEASLPYLLAVVDNWIDNELGSSYGDVEETTRYFDGGFNILMIDAVRDITSINLVESTDHNDIIDEYDLTEDISLQSINGDVVTYLEKFHGRFPCGVNNIAVTGKFNFGGCPPDDITYLASYLAGQTLTYSSQNNLKSESIEGYSRVYGSFDAKSDPIVSMILSRYAADSIWL